MTKIKHQPEYPKGRCYWNADSYVSSNGGDVLHGWMILLWPKVYAMAMHHAVVRTADGELLDITNTPFESGGSTTFLADEALCPPRDYPSYIENRFWLIRDDDLVRRLVKNDGEEMRLRRRRMDIAREAGIEVRLGESFKLPRTNEIVEIQNRLAAINKENGEIQNFLSRSS